MTGQADVTQWIIMVRSFSLLAMTAMTFRFRAEVLMKKTWCQIAFTQNSPWPREG
jgi:hypothetical protein